jgi:hypothetical protein
LSKHNLLEGTSIIRIKSARGGGGALDRDIVVFPKLC